MVAMADPGPQCEDGRMPWTSRDIPDLSGRTAVVTGANGGLGLETAVALAGAGAHVVMAARDQTKAQRARDELVSRHDGASVELVELDLADLASVRRAAGDIATAHPQVDILVNNAGLMAMPERATEDGFEMQFGVNHLGHWVFTSLLLPSVLAAPSARVVTVTSTARHFGRRVDPSNPHLRGKYRAWNAYGQAKLANFHFALGLDRRFRAAGAAAASLVAHPGLTNSDLQSRTVREGGGGLFGDVAHRLTSLIGMSPEVGARPQLRAATDPRAKGGQLYAPRFVNTGAAVRRPVLRRVGLDRSIEVLWEVSERETGVALAV